MVEAAVIIALGILVFAITDGWIPHPGLHTDFRRQNEWGEIPTRFSLRALFIATTIIAAMLGLAVWATG